MKKIITLLAVVGLVLFSACEGPEGPPGMPGQDGLDGADGLLGVVYENTSSNYYNFTANNNFKVRFNFPANALLFDSDVVLVYRLGDVVNGQAVWEFLPETYYFAEGARDFSFNFNFTYSYVDIYLNGKDLGTVPDEFRIEQIFRIVVVPADFAASVNKNNYLEVMKVLKLDESKIQKIEVQQ